MQNEPQTRLPRTLLWIGVIFGLALLFFSLNSHPSPPRKPVSVQAPTRSEPLLEDLQALLTGFSATSWTTNPEVMLRLSETPLYESYRIGQQLSGYISQNYPFKTLRKALTQIFQVTRSPDFSLDPAQTTRLTLHLILMSEAQSPGVNGTLKAQSLIRKLYLHLHQAYLREDLNSILAQSILRDLQQWSSFRQPLSQILEAEAQTSTHLMLKLWQDYPLKMWFQTEGDLAYQIQNLRAGWPANVSDPLLKESLPDFTRVLEPAPKFQMLETLIHRQIRSVSNSRALRTSPPVVLDFEGAMPVFGYQKKGQQAWFIPVGEPPGETLQ